ncbi:MAG TPA: hypothetical protein VK679_09375 [Gemmatimonadaceae bacterium]|nr:hypothetical protein [Gemmatimonadaceae bacterium]
MRDRHPHRRASHVGRGDSDRLRDALGHRVRQQFTLLLNDVRERLEELAQTI